MMRSAIHLKGHGKMIGTKIPNSLRLERAESWAVGNDNAGKYTAVVAGFIAATAFSSAEAQQAPLPPVNVDVPTTRAKPAASKPSPDALRARTALRRAARRAQPTTATPAVPYPNAGGLQAPNQNPYADAAAPYKVDRLQASGKFPEPLLNTPKTVTVLTKELLADENATSLKQAVLSTAGVTLGTGEGGNAFGDRFFIRGFDARNDVFVDGVRDAGVSVRENFFTEQVEILRGPASSYAGRGTAGGAVNIVTKQARTDRSFYGMDTTIGTDSTRRVTLDANQVITPSLAVRAGGLFQEAGVAGRNLTTDNRNGGYVATKWTPLDTVKITTGYVHTGLSGLPDFGVPYYRPSATTTAGGPFPDFGVNRRNFYGFVNRDFYKVAQDVGSLNAEVNITPDLTLTNKVRVQRSTNDYIGTLAERPNLALSTLSANPQSRYQVTDMVANQTEATYKFDTYNWKHTLLGGVEISRERSSIDSYTNLISEQTGQTGAVQTVNGSFTNVSIFNPQLTYLSGFEAPKLVGRPTKVKIDTNSVYVMDSANYQDVVILNGGVRYDDYTVNANGFSTVNNVASPVSSSQHSGLPNFNVGAVYKPMPIGSLYVAYATSSNPVGAEFDGTSPAYNGGLSLTGATSAEALGPEKNKSTEVGTKWELFDRHMLVTGALFETTKDNARETIAGIVQAGAAYRIRGIDLGVGGKVTDKLSLFGGLVLMQSEVTKSQGTPSNTALFGSSNVGLQLANIAHQSFNMLAKYQLTDVWEIGGSATYKSKIYGGSLVANVGTVLPSYWRFDTFVEAKIDKNWSAKLFVNNVFNKLYYDAMYASAAPFVLEAPGRSASFVLSGRF
jgi:catecholate siderophore receptor